MWLRKFGYFGFSAIGRQDPIMLFASYPVGYPMLKKLHQNFSHLVVVTHYTKPNERVVNQVDIFCKQKGIKTYHPVKKEESKQEKEREWADFEKEVKDTGKNFKLGIVCAYGYMIPSNIISLFEKGLILAHPSLIPKYRGGSPIFHAIANGQRESGASYMEVSANKFDHGNLLYQVKCPLDEKVTYQKAQADLSQLMADNVMHVIDNIDSLRPGKNQSEMDVSGIPPHQLEAKIYKQKHLDVNKPAEQVYNWSRAMISPRVHFKDQQIILFFDKVFLDDPQNAFKPGQVKLQGKHIYMKCSDRLVKLTGWQQISKKPLAIHTFINRFINKEKYNNDIFFT